MWYRHHVSVHVSQACLVTAISMTSEALLARARLWASRRVVILSGRDNVEEGQREESDEIVALVAAWRAHGLRVEFVDWEMATAASLQAPLAVFPLLAWSYCASTALSSQFCALLHSLRNGGAQPHADLRATAWHVHKRYLLELEEDGVPIVPTVVMEAATDGSLRSLPATLRTLRPAALRNAEKGGSCCFVVKPAVGGGGDGVERVNDDEAEAARTVRARGGWSDVLIQPFLSQVRVRGELSFVFINGELLHAVRKEPQGWDAAVSQPITRLDTPPAAAESTARHSLEVARRRCGVLPPSEIYLARVDLLPAVDEDGREVWLVSELELGWRKCTLFARSRSAATLPPFYVRATTHTQGCTYRYRVARRSSPFSACGPHGQGYERSSRRIAASHHGGRMAIWADADA